MAIIKSVLLGSVAALASVGFASAGCTVLGGLSYCKAVNQITYDNLGYSGTYKDVIGMDLKNCICKYSEKPFSGPLAPLNEQVCDTFGHFMRDLYANTLLHIKLSLHFRGPLHLKQFAVYMPAPSKKMKRSQIHGHIKRHAHHKRANKVITSTITETVVVDETGATIYPPPPHKEPPHKEPPHKEPPHKEPELYESPEPTPKPQPKQEKEDDETGDGWVRKAYYNGPSQVAEGLVFMNNHGGDGSGVFNMG